MPRKNRPRSKPYWDIPKIRTLYEKEKAEAGKEINTFFNQHTGDEVELDKAITDSSTDN